ncbi:MAG: T9SS type A sorting domain-containing protein [Bacteroidota bacterium]
MVWQKEFDNSGRGAITDIREDKDGNLVASLTGKIDPDDQNTGSVIKLNSSGNILWRWDIPDNYMRTDLSALEILEQGEIVVSGYALNVGMTGMGYAAMLSKNGNLIWEKTQLTGDQIRKVIYQNNKIYLMSRLQYGQGNEDLSNVLLVVLDQQGNITSTDTIQTLRGNQDLNIIEAPHGFLLGLTGGTPTSIGADIYLFGLNQQGQTLWSFPVEAEDTTLYHPSYSYQFRDFFYSKDGELFIVGNGGRGDDYAYLIKYGRDTTTVSIESDVSDQKQVSIFPNPTQDMVHIQPAHSLEYAIRLLDITGKLLLTRQGQHQETISLAAYPNGTYILQITDQDGEWQHAKVVKE